MGKRGASSAGPPGTERRSSSEIRISGKAKSGHTSEKRRQYKVVVMGVGGVGKSALTMRFVHGCFYEKLNATIEDLYQKELLVNSSEPVLVEILDTAGMEQFNNMTDLYIRNGDGFLLVFSMLDLTSLSHVVKLRDHILRVKDTTTDGVAMLLVGNKLDLVTSSSQLNAAKSLAQQCALPYMETSAKSSHNVDLAFTNLVQNIIVIEMLNTSARDSSASAAGGAAGKILSSGCGALFSRFSPQGTTSSGHYSTGSGGYAAVDRHRRPTRCCIL